MEDNLRKVAALAGGVPKIEMTEAVNGYSTDTASQRQRILDWLHSSPLTTLQARKELDIMHPAARVQELKQCGHNIVTHWTTDSAGKAKHRVASYVLFAEPSLSLGGGCDA
ncbi:helix-turn-helix domain-containing protein [Methylomonas sp. MK1]|uniref:helix-turn-helix domain-containing protein n=1 Tax=Methylomonas sp. MK1 TaxID=1131552 RepID=UPI00037E616C|nr:helix-turn-helix domain-containing protein [Methylomonas sp. MK1]